MSQGAIAAGDPQTAEAGAAMLRRGGNAVDAVVAASFASFIAEASIVNIGGGGVGLIADATTRARAAYDFFSVMPSGPLTEQADFHEVLVDFGPEQQPFHIGRASVAVPGVVAGLCAMAADHGTLPLPVLLEPAVHLADHGARLSAGQEYAYGILQPIFVNTPELAQIYVPQGRRYQVGERMRFPQLAQTLDRLGQTGPDDFYTGALAQAICADQAANHGLLTAADLAAYTVLRPAPIEIAYREFTIVAMPPSSVGGVLICFALRLLEGLAVGNHGHNSAHHARILAEVMRLTNLARPAWSGDERPVDERLTWFLSDAHVDRYRHQLIRLMDGADAPPEPTPYRGANDTTHISVVDSHGLHASVTTSAGENAGFVVGDTGICLNNMLGEADLHPQGFHAMAPGERLVTMMTPVVVEQDGRPILAVGSGGSNRIRSAIVQVLSNVLDFAMPLQAAVDAPRFHFESGVLQAEGGIDADVVEKLQRRGYRVNLWPARNMFFGGAHAVGMLAGQLTAAGDGRRGGSTVIIA